MYEPEPNVMVAGLGGTGQPRGDALRCVRNKASLEIHMTRTALSVVLCLTSLPSLSGLTGCTTTPTPSVVFLNPGTVLPDGLPFSEAVRVDNTLYLSGMVGITPGTMQLAPGGIEGESHQTMENIRLTLEAHGASLEDVVKCTVMLADISEWGTFNEVYKTYFTDRYPARSALGANGLALGARVEVECIAVIQND